MRLVPGSRGPPVTLWAAPALERLQTGARGLCAEARPPMLQHGSMCGPVRMQACSRAASEVCGMRPYAICKGLKVQTHACLHLSAPRARAN